MFLIEEIRLDDAVVALRFEPVFAEHRAHADVDTRADHIDGNTLAFEVFDRLIGPFFITTKGPE